MSLRYDLLVVDLDGTLLNQSGDVSERDIDAIHRAREAGVEFMVATGRAFVECAHTLQAINHQGWLVAAGGSMLVDSATGETVDRRTLPHDVVHEVSRCLLDDGHKVLILKDSHRTGYEYVAVGESEMDPASKWWFDRIPARVRHLESLDHDEHPEDSLRAGAVGCSSRLAPIAGTLRTQLGERCFLQHWSAVTESAATGSSTHLLEVFTANVNKWTMISAHCQRQGIDPKRVAAIGDGLNDVEMLRNAGLGIAMANAGPEAMASAARITNDHNNHGVSEAIDRILVGEW